MKTDAQKQEKARHQEMSRGLLKMQKYVAAKDFPHDLYEGKYAEVSISFSFYNGGNYVVSVYDTDDGFYQRDFSVLEDALACYNAVPFGVSPQILRDMGFECF